MLPSVMICFFYMITKVLIYCLCTASRDSVYLVCLCLDLTEICSPWLDIFLLALLYVLHCNMKKCQFYFVCVYNCLLSDRI